MKFWATDTVRATSEETFAWWMDVGEDDANGVMPPLRRRHVVRRTAAEIEVEDRWSIYGIPMRTRAVLRPKPPNAWEVWTTFRGGAYHDVVVLEPVAGGTRVSMELSMDELRWPWTWIVLALRPAIARLFQSDLEAVNRALEESLTRGHESASPTPPDSGTPPGSTRRP